MNLTPIFMAVTSMLGLPPGLLSAVCTVESNHRVAAISFNDGGTDSLGACQIKERTAFHMGFRGTRRHLWQDPHVNIYYAGKFLKYQLDKHGGNVNKALSAYNAGHYITGNKLYVNKVLKVWAIRE